jgi:hypothetical protein
MHHWPLGHDLSCHSAPGGWRRRRARSLVSAEVEIPDWCVGVVASRHRVPGALVVVVGAGQELKIKHVPAFRRNMPPIIADLTLGALAATVLMATTVIAAIVLTPPVWQPVG